MKWGDEKLSETIHFEEKEYRAYEALAKKAGYESVDELVNEAVEYLIRIKLMETEEVTVKVPKKLLAFAKNIRPDTIAYLSDLLTDSIAADLMTGDYGDPDQLKKEYDITQEFQFYEGH